VAGTLAGAPSSVVPCKVCDMSSRLFGVADVLGRYHVQYFRCEGCGFIQTEAMRAASAFFAAAKPGCVH
jgi:hypothetical protein